MKEEVNLPFIKLYTKDILANAAKTMTLEAFGAYVILLCFAWGEEPAATIPKDETIIRRAIGVDPEPWARIREQVLAKFQPWEEDKSRLVNVRCRHEWLEAQEAHKKNSKRGKAGADARWNGKDKPDGFDVQEELD